MMGWFGRKSAPADVRPFVPAWLTNESTEVWLTSCDEEALARGSNLGTAGREVLQFADVEPL